MTGFVDGQDDAQIFYKDWGSGPAIMLHHGWPLSADDWDAQMLFFLHRGFRVVAHDRRGHGRSSQGFGGDDMDTYADDVAAVVEHLDLEDVVHIGHSTGGGEVARYLARHGVDRASKAVLMSSVPPLLLKTDANPNGVPVEVFDGLRAGVAGSRAQFYWDFPIPFYGFNREGASVMEGVRANWWRQGMMGSAHSHYECVKALSETDFHEDLKAIDIPALVMHGDDDQIVPIALSAMLSSKLLPHGELKVYPGYPHGMATIHADTINADLLAFIEA